MHFRIGEKTIKTHRGILAFRIGVKVFNILAKPFAGKVRTKAIQNFLEPSYV